MKRNVRKRVITKQLSSKKNTQALERKVDKLIKKTNAKIDALQRRHKGSTWASKRLINKLSQEKLKSVTKSGKVKKIKNATKTQLNAQAKAMQSFLRSKTSTHKGIEEVRQKTIKSLKEEWSIDDEDMTYDEAEALYDMFGDDDFTILAEKIPSSALQACVQDAIEANDDENEFIKRLEAYSSISIMPDERLRNAAIKLYNKYVM